MTSRHTRVMLSPSLPSLTGEKPVFNDNKDSAASMDEGQIPVDNDDAMGATISKSCSLDIIDKGQSSTLGNGGRSSSFSTNSALFIRGMSWRDGTLIGVIVDLAAFVLRAIFLVDDVAALLFFGGPVVGSSIPVRNLFLF